MKVIMFEANAEELSSNRRLADALTDAMSSFIDSIVRLDCPAADCEEEEEEEDEVDD